MISFRYHVVTLVSVFLALAVGIALGGGPLQGEVDDSLVGQIEADRARKATLSDRISALRSDLRYTDAFAEALSPEVVDGSLEGNAVAVVTLPGANDALVPDLTTLVEQAGGSVAATYRLSPALLDPEQRQLVDELGRQLVAGAEDVQVTGDPAAYERMGQIIGRAIGVQGAPEPLDAGAEALQSGLATAELLASAGSTDTRADLVLVVAPPGIAEGTAAAEDDAASFERSGAGEILASLLSGVDEQVDGVVLTGPTSAAVDDGALRSLLADVGAARRVSTVDPVNLTTGKVALVLALAEQAAGGVGHYSAAGGSDGALPAASDATGDLAGDDTSDDTGDGQG
ncbi:copper transporter [Nocardioidaceae bacterium]|nr:copper transporter [Nocardioidaceae bacterium]